MRPDLLNNFDSGISSFEVGDDLLPNPLRFRSPGDES
jgi:hypothetical protein